jgi:hypothetical protein
LSRPFEIWLSYHPGNDRIRKMRRKVGWLVAVFDPAKFQWFKDEFLDPMEL